MIITVLFVSQIRVVIDSLSKMSVGAVQHALIGSCKALTSAKFQMIHSKCLVNSNCTVVFGIIRKSTDLSTELLCKKDKRLQESRHHPFPFPFLPPKQNISMRCARLSVVEMSLRADFLCFFLSSVLPIILSCVLNERTHDEFSDSMRFSILYLNRPQRRRRHQLEALSAKRARLRQGVAGGRYWGEEAQLC